MYEAILAVIAAGLWLAGGYQVRKASRHRGSTPAVAALAVALNALGLAVTIQVPVVAHWIDDVAGRAQTAQLAGQLSGVAAVCAAQCMLVFIGEPNRLAARKVRRRVVIAALAGGALVGIFIGAPPGQSPLSSSGGVGNAFGAAYVAVYGVYAGSTAADVARLSWRYAQLVTRVFVRVGLQLVAIGGALGVVYAIGKLGFTAAKLGGATVGTIETAVIPAVFLPMAVCLVVGCTVPAWGPHVRMLDRPAMWISSVRSLRTLQPLWWALVAAVPDVELPVELHGVREKLARRVVEIRDALVRLRPDHGDPRVFAARDVAAEMGLSGERLDALLEAVAVAAALRLPRGDPDEIDRAQRGGRVDLAPGDEVVWLTLVGYYFRHSRLVARVLTAGPADPEAGPLAAVDR